MAKPVSVEVDSTDVSEALQRLSNGLQDAFRTQMTDQVRKIVRDAQGRVPRRTGAARASLDVEQGQEGAEIVAGGRRVPYYAQLEWGGRPQGRGRVVTRPFIRDGRFLGPAIIATLDEVERAAARAVVQAGGGTVDGA